LASLPFTPGIFMLSLPRHRRPVLVGSRYLIVSRGSYCRSFRLPRTLVISSRGFLPTRLLDSHGLSIHSRGPCCSLWLPRTIRVVHSSGPSGFRHTAIHFHVACRSSTRLESHGLLISLIYSSSSRKHSTFRTLCNLSTGSVQPYCQSFVVVSPTGSVPIVGLLVL
jgi:hypothetical protein